MKNHQRLVRIFFSLIFVSTQFLLLRNIDFGYIFYAKKRLVNPTDPTYPESAPACSSTILDSVKQAK